MQVCRATRLGVRQQHLRGTAFDQHLLGRDGIELGQRVCDEHDSSILLAKREQPLLDPVRKRGAHERRPQLFDHDQRRTAIELLSEEVESQNPVHRAVVFTPELVVRQSTATPAAG